jgi:hypothetical protein
MEAAEFRASKKHDAARERGPPHVNCSSWCSVAQSIASAVFCRSASSIPTIWAHGSPACAAASPRTAHVGHEPAR